MNEIKVTVSYEKPTTSKFDALMAEYEAAKKYADETVAYYKPLADAAEEAKMSAILEQLETIKVYANILSGFSAQKQATIRAYISSSELDQYCHTGSYFSVYCSPRGTYLIRWNDIEFTIENLKTRNSEFTSRYSKKHDIIGRWDEWGVYQRLEKDAFAQLQRYINDQNERAQKQINRLNNITKGGN